MPAFSHLISSYRCNKSIEVLLQFYLLWLSVIKTALPVIGVPDDLPTVVPNTRLDGAINLLQTLSQHFFLIL